jgi:ABC-type lipoprotein export system ATPase subunit
VTVDGGRSNRPRKSIYDARDWLTASASPRSTSVVLVATHDQRVIDVADQTVHLSSGRVAA